MMLEIAKLKQMSQSDFLTLGNASTAYVKRVEADGLVAYAAHAADGTYITLFTDRDIAFEALREYDLDPVSLH
ncbi:MAG TPA: DUF1150 family protein [Stellaceae bacterium]|nr:DUF1150 family protein [Stellaceae bacterium]